MSRQESAPEASPRTGSVPPAISVLLPVYNAASTLAACLASLRRQSERDWECVIVDDGSTDDSRRVARRFAAAAPRLRILRREHGGLVRALNHGLRACRGRWIARMDADDLMHRERLAAQRALLARRPDWIGLGCHVRLFPRYGLGPGIRAYERWLNAPGRAARLASAGVGGRRGSAEPDPPLSRRARAPRIPRLRLHGLTRRLPVD